MSVTAMYAVTYLLDGFAMMVGLWYVMRRDLRPTPAGRTRALAVGTVVALTAWALYVWSVTRPGRAS